MATPLSRGHHADVSSASPTRTFSAVRMRGSDPIPTPSWVSPRPEEPALEVSGSVWVTGDVRVSGPSSLQGPS